jgi:xanthine dehydrogenase YagS FAD-binding subunit
MRDEATAERVAALAARGARPLNFNGFKIPLLENLVRRAVRGGGA